MTSSNLFSSFKDDRCRLAAMRSRDQRDVSIAKLKAGVFGLIALALIVSGHADSVATWLAGVGALWNLRS